MSDNYLIKNSLKKSNKAFSELDSSLFVKIDLCQAEKVSGGGVGTSPKDFTVSGETKSSTWALSIMF